MRRFVLFLCGVIVLVAVTVCFDVLSSSVSVIDSSLEDVSIPAGLQQTIEGLPHIESFSSSEYEDYEYHYPPVDYALLYCNGIAEEIDSDDPRLFRLLNFLANSEHKTLSAWRQGYVEEAEIEEYLNSHHTMLQICFSYGDSDENNSISHTTQLLICGHSYLAFIDTSRSSWTLGDGKYAEQCFPYMALLEPLITSGAIKKDVLYQNNWGDKSWIDLLVYAGF